MHNFFMGLVIGIQGLVVLLAGVILQEINDVHIFFLGRDVSVDYLPIRVVGVVVLLLGPLLFWAVAPLISWASRRRRPEVK